MTGESQYILVAIRLNRASRAQRLTAVEAAIRHAVRVGIDEISLEPDFMESPPANLAEAVNKWIRTARKKGRWRIFERPSSDDINLALSAAPFVVSVNLVTGRRAIVTIADAADALSLQILETDWDALLTELEEALGGRVDYDVAELASSD